VNNAGIATPHNSFDIPIEEIEKYFQVNVFGTIYLTRAAVRHMGKGGRIINITSMASKMGLTSLPIYGATKAAIDSLSFSWAKEVSRIQNRIPVYELT
jgi:NAD(P)-dependent dehydrogenase (short-subunit alcohol dehydrogenase family)